MPDVTLQEYLQKLLADRAALDAMIGRVQADLGLGPSENGTVAPVAGVGVGGSRAYGNLTVTGQVRPDEFFRMSVPEAIKRYLEIMKQPQTPKAITDGLKSGGVLSEAKHFYANVWTALKRLRATGVVVNTKTGGWGLAEWYAGRSGGATPEKPKRGRGKPRKRSAFQTFMSEQMKGGKKSLKEAQAAWRERKESGS